MDTSSGAHLSSASDKDKSLNLGILKRAFHSRFALFEPHVAFTLKRTPPIGFAQIFRIVA
jgi:hypothetical protein